MIVLSHIEFKTATSRSLVPLAGDDLDLVFRAVAHRVRREILDLLREGPKTTGELVMAFPELSRYAVMQHLGVLQKADLVVSHHEGRVRVNHLNAVPIRRIYERWVSRYEGHWAGALLALKSELEEERSPQRPRRSPSGARGMEPARRGRVR